MSAPAIRFDNGQLLNDVGSTLFLGELEDPRFRGWQLDRSAPDPSRFQAMDNGVTGAGKLSFGIYPDKRDIGYVTGGQFNRINAVWGLNRPPALGSAGYLFTGSPTDDGTVAYPGFGLQLHWPNYVPEYTRTITAATTAAESVFTSAAYNFANGAYVMVTGSAGLTPPLSPTPTVADPHPGTAYRVVRQGAGPTYTTFKLRRLSDNAYAEVTASALTGSITGTITGTTTVTGTISDIAEVRVGATVTGAGIPGSTTVTAKSLDGLSFTLSQAATNGVDIAIDYTNIDFATLTQMQSEMIAAGVNYQLFTIIQHEGDYDATPGVVNAAHYTNFDCYGPMSVRRQKESTSVEPPLQVLDDTINTATFRVWNVNTTPGSDNLATGITLKANALGLAGVAKSGQWDIVLGRDSTTVEHRRGLFFTGGSTTQTPMWLDGDEGTGGTVYIHPWGNLEWDSNWFSLGAPTGGIVGPAHITLSADDPYAAGWDGNLGVPTKNAIYDKIQSLGGGAAGADGKVQYAVGGAFTADTDFAWDAANNRLQVPEVRPTGPLAVGTVGLNALFLGVNSLNQWSVSTDGHLYPTTDDAWDLGAPTFKVAHGYFAQINASSQIISTLATGFAPFVVASTTNVPNLNASSLNGATFANPGPIGATPDSGAFTTLSATTSLSLNGQVFLYPQAAAVVELGLDNATTPTNQTLKAHDVTTGTGAALTLKGGTGTSAVGSAIVLNGGISTTTGGSIILQTAATGTLTDRLTITAAGAASFGAGVDASTFFRAAATGAFYILNRMSLTASADGIILLRNYGETDLNRLCLGGTTSSFPALKRRAAALEARLGDDSAITTLVGAMVLKAGAVSDADFTNPVDGCQGYDTTNFKHYVRSGGTWRSSAAYS